MVGTTSIRWNNLQLDIPEQWEIIVKSPRHLIFEKNLTPVAEIRWQPPAKKSRKDRTRTIARQLEPGGDYRWRPDSAGLFPAALKQRFGVKPYRLADDSEEIMVLLTCKKCGTILLTRIYDAAPAALKEFIAVLVSLDCHPEAEVRGSWQILDFYFWLPDGFELERSTFRFGLTTLVFTSSDSELRLCRLAPASHHLQRGSLAALFQSFSSAPPAEQSAVDQFTLVQRRAPGTIGRLWGAIRRKKLYQSSRFVHFPHHDRILGYSIRSRGPIEERLETMLADGYGIVQKEENATGVDA